MPNVPGPSQKYSGVFDFRFLQDLAARVEVLEKILGKAKKIQFGVVDLNWPGGTEEATSVKVAFERELPAAPANSFFLTPFASGQFPLVFVGGGTTQKELEVSCVTTDHSKPPAGTKQKIFWMVISSA